MHHICKTSVLPYSAGQVMALIEDIRSYPQFLPWCGRTRIIQDRGEEVIAEITISHGAFGKSFTTKNRYQRPKLAEVRLVNGPFRFLEGLWQLEPDPKGTKVTLDMRFEFASRLVGAFLEPIFKQAAETMVQRFAQRARAIYGPPAAIPATGDSPSS
ncbi:type II toxin-antitoxin system RatA family toxin [Acidithiobacillus sp. HP-6]|uniref:type II toxin-antitoxin system RatA family toxin n=1 Tax=unclassified Acidithiobacillus TaxID=2614800 RepID=UPI00187A9FA0|nr:MULTISPECIES: type II toxin-antitoxin system RatA family toxin [unclassified Acidithiobacillus]MBE7561914.1 type II toxin-antitoxin system RatA family toxin [Acidithiobacillus sp. HP-6]MBE7568586.1 type II toxin-antitoxin system RatA family toxin [Acidithiobacillus sp. HP-2]MDD2750665.1 type II toxin-antitoxin system RatA family toxin [Acidithiobacillus sp.]MDD5278503.1 type II toxin-antitoxin system RatA family toxin [Acidithiobacillus sp.]